EFAGSSSFHPRRTDPQALGGLQREELSECCGFAISERLISLSLGLMFFSGRGRLHVTWRAGFVVARCGAGKMMMNGQDEVSPTLARQRVANA
ncbi:unnamed protein product, partial [Amoebophrya sp. A120]